MLLLRGSRHYFHSLLPHTLRVGGSYVLIIISLLLGGDVIEAATCLALATLLLQASLAACTGVQQATLMLTSRKLSMGHAESARDVIRLAAFVLLLLASVVCEQPFCLAMMHITRPRHALPRSLCTTMMMIAVCITRWADWCAQAALGFHAGGARLGRAFSSDARISAGLTPLLPYIAPAVSSNEWLLALRSLHAMS